MFIIAGATATGKTAVALELARKIGGEIISADSMQVYRGMNIGTAKPTAEEMRGIPHHLLDVVNPDEDFSAAEFQRLARIAVEEIRARGKVPIIAGGTGFYINALLYDTEFSSGETEKENLLREEFTALAKAHGAEFLHEKLAAADPEYAATLHANNIKRVARALAFIEARGELFSAHNSQKERRRPNSSAKLFVLSMPREVLYARINARTEAMFASGFVEEVYDLREKGYHKGLAAMRGIGYKEVGQFLDGECTRKEAIDATAQATRNYAKRQQTWFRNQSPDAVIIDIDGKTPTDIAAQIGAEPH